ncbi:FAD-binding oxidoreductase [Streptomyces iconiensis]|uniref:FAD-binding oxidoreductase n=1 Tax=Streptomyces iconiensis TaxID=1384038 RepID=A0ABT6ZV68_9ACTN|nr:FAD-binding oxidoreductase [Streptomyces iconiensis]MDJ1132732.1 FAD-binding oxidoreductase [Streptomyces iconiensis]
MSGGHGPPEGAAHGPVPEGLPAALAAWRQALGTPHVRTDPGLLNRLSAATYPTNVRVPAALYPADVEQVRECVAIASRNGVALHPVSTGKNWGYGSACPVGDGTVVMSLARMDRILDYDEELAYVTVEPGVTQQDLYAFLSRQGARLLPSVTGSTPDSSLIGNVLERGLGEGAYGDRFAHVCGMEAILGTGEIVRTGFSGFTHAPVRSPVGAVHRWGRGPWPDGLFTQSNLGVVTRMTLWLAPEPGALVPFSFRTEAGGPVLAAVVDAVRRLRMDRILDTGFVIANDVREISARQRSPWHGQSNREPMPAVLRGRLRARWDLGAWNGGGALHAADDRHGADLRRLVRARLEPHVSRLVFGAGAEATPLQRGEPTDAHLAMAYWRTRAPVPPRSPDLDADGCGLIWVCPVVPLLGRHVTAAVELIEEITAAHGFDANLSLNSVAERSAVITAALAYDRSDADEERRAMVCHDALHERTERAGYPSYRLSSRARRSSCGMAADGGLAAMLRRIKCALDPAGVISPGR